jgi:SAM-dependent methyltransferase
MPEFDTRDPTRPDFWDERFELAFTPWDAGKVPSRLSEFVARQSTPLRSLIAGCGSAWEARFLAESGWDVCAIDFSSHAVAKARAQLGPWAHVVQQADFFQFSAAPFDLIYERAFLCALPRATWPDIVQRWADLLTAHGLLAGFFYFDSAPKGPPFGADAAQLQALLQTRFTLVQDLPVDDSIAVFAGKERWQVWQRRD